jgi:hypothetical protein|eukprot:evm.model.NODE_19310_length_24751_cov_15.882955.6
MATDLQPKTEAETRDGTNGASGGGGVVCTVEKALFVERMRRLYKSWNRQKAAAWYFEPRGIGKEGVLG